LLPVPSCQTGNCVPLISDLLSSPEGIALAKGFMQIEDRVVRRHIVKLVTQIGASGTSKK